MADDPVSFEEATEDLAAQDDSDPEPEDEYDSDIETQTAEELFDDPKSIVQTVPDFLQPESRERRVDRPDIGGRRGQFDLDFGDLSQLDNGGLLEVIARVNIAQLASLFDIADSVEPFQSITVSGTNIIDQPDVAEPVVPESDEELIPTRTLFIKADENNSKRVYFGDDQVDPDSGFALERGESITLDTDLRAEELYMASEDSGQQIQLLGMV